MRSQGRVHHEPADSQHQPVLVVDRDQRFVEAVRAHLHAGRCLNPVLAYPDAQMALRHLTGAGLRRTQAHHRAVAVVVSFDFEECWGQRVLRAVTQGSALRSVPVVVVGQGADEDEVNEAMDLGATAYISKLVAAHVLPNIIRGFNMPWSLAAPEPQAGSV